MQAEISTAGGSTTPAQITTEVTAGPHVQSVNATQPLAAENPDPQSMTTSVISTLPEQSLVSFSRKHVPSDEEGTVTTDVVTLSAESTANLRHRFGGADKSNGEAGAYPKSGGAWQPFPLASLMSRRRNLSASEKKTLKKGTIQYYRKQSRWVDELVEVDRLLRTTPTTTKLPPIPVDPATLATRTELETLLEHEHEQDLDRHRGSSDAPARSCGCFGPTRQPAVGAPATGTTHSASVEVLNLPASAPPANDDGLKVAVAEERPEVVIPVGLSSFETQLSVNPSAPNANGIGSDGDADGDGAGDGNAAEAGEIGKTVEQLRRESDQKNILATRVAKVLLCINLVLIGFKLAAVILSGSLAVVAVLVDNAVDLASGVVIWVSNVAIRKRNIYNYPQGRKRLEPVGIVVLAAIMAVASAQVIMESVTKLVHMLMNPAEPGPDMGWVPIGLLIADFTTKTTLFIVFFRFRKGNPSIQALQLDLRNDMVSNVASLASGLVATYFFKYVDPGIAILIALYIAFSWGRQLIRQARMLTGYTAPKEFLNTITWIAVSHDPRIVQLETVRAFHAGLEYFVEVDIVLPTNMSVREAHDIGESLQQKLELLSNVARAFVHVDHESYHNPETEHKAG